MRIISGTLRSKKLFTPKDDTKIRPTSDRAREAVFSIINAKLDTPFSELSVLDIFSGTGALGLEAASRGAKDVTFIDIDLSLTIKNAQLCNLNNLHFIKKDATKLPPAHTPFDLIFMDAPYNQGLTTPTLKALIKGNYLKPETLVIAETAKDEILDIPTPLELIDERTYGAARFSFLMLIGEKHEKTI